MVVTGTGTSDAPADRVSERWNTRLAGALLLLVAATAGLLAQGAYYPSMQRPLAVLIAAATLLSLASWPLTRDDLRLLPVMPALALAAWAVLDGALLGVGGGVGPALLLVGLVVLAGLRGLGATARAAAGPVAGALLALVALLPSMPATSPPRPTFALAGLGAGLALAAMAVRVRRWPAFALAGGVLVAGAVGLLATGGLGAAQAVLVSRANLASPDRTGALHAALRLIALQPLTGTGPGHADLRWKWTSSSASLRDPGPASPRASASPASPAPDQASRSPSVSKQVEGRSSRRARRWYPPRSSAATTSPAAARQIAGSSKSNASVTNAVH